MFRWLLIALMAATSLASAHDCSPGLIPHGNYCYDFVMDNMDTWYLAKDDCEHNGGFITGILCDDDEHSFVLEKLKKILNSQKKGHKFFWTSYDYVINAPWESVYEDIDNTQAEGETCAVMWSGNGKGYVYPCDDNERIIYGWVCKYRIE